MAVAEAVAEEVATNLEEIAEVTRRIDGRAVSLLFGGLLIGIPIGFYFGYKWNKSKIYADAFQAAEDEIDQMRDMYQSREIARAQKPGVEEIIEERGYSTVAPRPLKAPVPIEGSPLVAVPPRAQDEGWDYPTELAQRSEEQPYVIHQDEFANSELGYSQTTYTYYTEDGILADVDKSRVPHAEIVVGQDNLKWGHGTDDVDVVFVRNDKLELEIEICRVHKSYEEEVLGHDRNATD